MTYHPSQEPDVVLKCGCIDWAFGAVKVLGNGYEEQYCDTHQDWFRILRKASNDERTRFYLYGIPAATRATSKPRKPVSDMPGSNTSPSTQRAWDGQQVLF